MHRSALSVKREICRSLSSEREHRSLRGKLHRDRNAFGIHVAELSTRRTVLQHHPRRNTRRRTDQAGPAGSFTGNVCARFEVDEALRRSNVRKRRQEQALCKECGLRRHDHHSLPHAARKFPATDPVGLSLHGG